jgi:hypothetical protein
VDTKQKTTEQDAFQYWRRSARKSRRERIRNTVIREMMEVEEKNFIERIKQKRLWNGKQKAGEGKAGPWEHGWY